MNPVRSIGQWIRARIVKDHDGMHGTQRQYDREIPKVLTQAEIRRGLEL